MAEKLDVSELDKSGRFYHRGRDTTRLEAFIDAAFAFALTLLVISFDEVPQSYDALVSALRAVPAFLMAFGVLAVFWIAHRNWSMRFGLDTTFATLVSLALVFIILVYVYPLRAMSAAAMNAMSGGYLESEFVVETVGEVRGLFVIYGIGFFISTCCIVLLNWHAFRRAEQLSLTPQEQLLTKYEMAAWSIVGSFGLLSSLLAISLPDRLVGVAGWLYIGFSVVMPIFGTVTERRYTERFGS